MPLQTLISLLVMPFPPWSTSWSSSHPSSINSNITSSLITSRPPGKENLVTPLSLKPQHPQHTSVKWMFCVYWFLSLSRARFWRMRSGNLSSSLSHLSVVSDAWCAIIKVGRKQEEWVAFSFWMLGNTPRRSWRWALTRSVLGIPSKGKSTCRSTWLGAEADEAFQRGLSQDWKTRRATLQGLAAVAGTCNGRRRTAGTPFS